ncbi:winged helix-turn-helix transcriptional regulator [Roseibium sediminicola]|uniref:Helix-turn-helix transcriptional regulator n=1 Tax=Roseibium sediminicola TaxID=2933272 RepID=A0ABT0H0F7_9HYPH|nr:helix-turn-helix domain-containing protein [Roseibium sp. CAU 1639]MCK7614940.1 helix-turn-helix transcriptional regulator [Roseibium sp. CAU 1639]
MNKQKIPWSGCPVRYAAGILADKWTFLLLRDALLHGKRSYGDFLNSEEGISTNILADRLAKLVATGMFFRKVHPQKKNMVCYFPTAKAIALLPASLSIMIWSVTYDDDTEAPQSFSEGFARNPAGIIQFYENRIDEASRQAHIG